MYEKELKISTKIVLQAERTFIKYFGTRTQVKMKGENYRDLVSYADQKIEQDIKKALVKNFPSYGFIGEESDAITTKGRFTWALDPIDGTTNYLHGLPDCCISLALLKDNKPVMGIVYAPIHKSLYTAAAGGKAMLNGKHIRASKAKSLAHAFGACGWAKNIKFGIKAVPKLMKKSLKIRVPGSAALAFCEVARGSFDFYVQSELSIWDYAAGRVIVEQAGGVFIDNKKSKIAAATKTLITEVSKQI